MTTANETSFLHKFRELAARDLKVELNAGGELTVAEQVLKEGGDSGPKRMSVMALAGVFVLLCTCLVLTSGTMAAELIKRRK